MAKKAETIKITKAGREELFCLEYINDFNGTQAYLRAGFKVTYQTARVEASKLLAKPNVLARVKELIRERAERLCLDADNVVLRLIDIYEKCMSEKPVLAFNYDTRQMEETGEYVFDSKGALKATELIGRHLAMFKDKLELSGELKIADSLAAARKRVQDAAE